MFLYPGVAFVGVLEWFLHLTLLAEREPTEPGTVKRRHQWPPLKFAGLLDISGNVGHCWTCPTDPPSDVGNTQIDLIYRLYIYAGRDDANPKVEIETFWRGVGHGPTNVQHPVTLLCVIISPTSHRRCRA